MGKGRQAVSRPADARANDGAFRALGALELRQQQLDQEEVAEVVLRRRVSNRRRRLGQQEGTRGEGKASGAKAS